MKKISLLFALPLLALTACGGKTPAPSVWSDEFLALLDTYCNGVEIPYFDMGEYTAYYDEDFECISVEGDYYAENYKDSVAKAFSDSDWTVLDQTEDMGFDYIACSMIAGNTAYNVDVYGEVADGGNFIEMDIYTSGTWDADTIELINQYIGEVDIPYFDMGEYTAYYDEDYECVSVEGDSFDEDSLATIMSLFSENEWDVEDDTEEMGFDAMSATLGYDDGTYYVDVYGEEGFVEMDIYNIEAYKVTFETDEHCSVTVYTDQDCTEEDDGFDSYFTRSGDDGSFTTTDGQVNFVVTVDEGYVISSVEATEGTYKNIKGPSETEIENAYRVTKITGPTTITVTTTEAEEEAEGWAITFETDEHVRVHVYSDKACAGDYVETTSTECIDETTLRPTKEKDAGQVYFVLVFDEGYELDSIEATPAANYKNLKKPEDTGVTNGYRLTKVNGEVTVTIVSKAA